MVHCATRCNIPRHGQFTGWRAGCRTPRSGARVSDDRADGARAHTSFVNLLESPLDGGIVVVASFIEAFAPIGSPIGNDQQRDTDDHVHGGIRCGLVEQQRLEPACGGERDRDCV